jgi:polyribonucleotide nucleotidyltransferase
MNKYIDAPRFERKDSWPVSERMTLEPHQRQKIFGHGGMQIKRLFLETGAQMTQIEDDAYELFAPSQSALEEAKEIIQKLIEKERIPDLGLWKITLCFILV